MIPGREIVRRSRYARNEVRELLQSIFVSELLRPSKEIWLVSPWLSDIEVVDDTAAQIGVGASGRSPAGDGGRASSLSARSENNLESRTFQSEIWR